MEEGGYRWEMGEGETFMRWDNEKESGKWEKEVAGGRWEKERAAGRWRRRERVGDGREGERAGGRRERTGGQEGESGEKEIAGRR